MGVLYATVLRRTMNAQAAVQLPSFDPTQSLTTFANRYLDWAKQLFEDSDQLSCWLPDDRMLSLELRRGLQRRAWSYICDTFTAPTEPRDPACDYAPRAPLSHRHMPGGMRDRVRRADGRSVRRGTRP